MISSWKIVILELHGRGNSRCARLRGHIRHKPSLEFQRVYIPKEASRESFTVAYEFPKTLAHKHLRRVVLLTYRSKDICSSALTRSFHRRSTSQRRCIRRSIFIRVTWIPFENVRPGTMGLFEQYPAKRAAEILVEDGVDEGVQGRVHVAEPERDHKRLCGYFDAREQRFRDVKDEEWQPAGDKAAHDKTEYQSGSFLLLSRQSPLLSLRVPRFRRF